MIANLSGIGRSLGGLSLADWIVIAGIAFAVAARIFKALGWNKGALIAGELQNGVNEAQKFIVTSREAAASGTPGTAIVSVSNVAEKIAANVPGVKATDVRAIAATVLTGQPLLSNGLSVTMDPATGKVSVDASGLAAKSVHKLGKFFKKVF